MTIGMPICTQTFTRNIVLLGSGPAEVGTPASSHKDVRRSHWASNTYWASNSTVASALRTAAVWPNGTTWQQWSASVYAGRTGGRSIIADPQFVDAYEGSFYFFKLRPSSPALERGFVQVDPSSAGCRDNPFEQLPDE